MKLNKFTILLLIVYCIPFVFLSMYDDYKNYSMFVYGLTIIIVWFFAFWAKRKSTFLMLFIANILSFLSSYFWILHVNQIEDWQGYFKPLTTVQLLVFNTVLISLLQVVVYVLTRPVGKIGKEKKRGN